MTRRVMHALAALAVFTVASLVWAQPAQAAPTALCSTEEWRNPAGFADCTRRLAAAAGNQGGCVTAPSPGSPTSGMPGYFTSRPDSSLRSGVAGQYSMYGVGGYGLDTYDIGCLGSVKHPEMVWQNSLASGEFTVAASIMGATNGLREHAYDPGSMWAWSDGFVADATNSIFKYVFSPLGVLMFAVIGLYLLWHARQGNMSHTLQVTAWAIFVMTAVTGVAHWPVAAAHGADAVASAGLRTVHSAVGPRPQNLPADRCVLGGDACNDNRSVAVRASDIATEAVLYRTWLRAVLGSADTDTARKYGPALYDATTLSWGEAARAEQSPQLRQQLLDQKAQTWNTIAEQVRVEDPIAYEHLQGIHGTDRAGNGMVAVLSALIFALFDSIASVVILFGFMIFRVAIILLPLLGTLGVFLPAAHWLRRAFHMTVAAAVNIMVFGAGGGLYLTIVDLVFDSPMPGAAQLVVIALAAAAAFFLLRPLRHLVHTATGRSRAEDSLTARLIKAGKQLSSNRSAPADSTTADTVADGPAPTTPRPETASPRPSTARTVVTAVAPSVASATGNPTVAAVFDAFGNTGTGTRPETTSKMSKVKNAARVAATVAATAAGGPAAGAAATAATSASPRRPSPRQRPETRS